MKLLLRGASSITGDNQPLFVVDGVPIDNSDYSSYNQQRGACADGSLGGGTDGDLPPHRFTLPLDEATLNEANWDAAGGATNTLNTPLWWDVN